MTASFSILSLAAGSAYLLVLLACLAATVTAVQTRQVPAHLRTWLAIGILFAALAASRFLGLEQAATETLRASIKASGLYDERRTWQAPAAAIVLALAGGAALMMAYIFARHQRGRRNHARVVAVLAGCCMLVLVALRFTSFHAVDYALYGPLKLNWVVDLGSTLAVLGAAVYYVRIVRAQP